MIGLDIGRHGTRLVMDGYRDSFLSCIGEARDIHLENNFSKEDMDVLWRGRHFLVGRIAERECDDAGMLRTESKAHQDTLLLALCALHRALPDDAHARIVTGIPIASFKKDEREQIKKLFVGTETLHMNGISKTIHIDEVYTVPESAAAYFSFGTNMKECRLIDLGSRTTGYATIINNNFIDRLSGTFPIGAENFVGSQSAYVRWIVNSLSGRWNLSDPIYLIGGMAEVTFPLFAEYMPNVKVTPDPIFANAQAYYWMGVKKHGQK